jgi:hypothetical protein
MIAVPLYKNREPVRVTAPAPQHMKERLTICGWPGEDPTMFSIAPAEPEVEAGAAQ